MRRSRFNFGTDSFIPLLPLRPWLPGTPTIGGSRVSAAGVPASFVVRRDHTLEFTLRVFESEWPDVEALVAYGQASLPITWYPDVDEPGISYQLYLDAPAAGEKLTPTRGEFPRTFEQALTMRSVTGSAFQPYFE